jgi:hypothetical protein
MLLFPPGKDASQKHRSVGQSDEEIHNARKNRHNALFRKPSQHGSRLLRKIGSSEKRCPAIILSGTFKKRRFRAHPHSRHCPEIQEQNTVGKFLQNASKTSPRRCSTPYSRPSFSPIIPGKTPSFSEEALPPALAFRRPQPWNSLPVPSHTAQISFSFFYCITSLRQKPPQAPRAERPPNSVAERKRDQAPLACGTIALHRTEREGWVWRFTSYQRCPEK